MNEEDKYWYVGLTYRKEKWIKEKLDTLQIENFLPIKEDLKVKDGRKIKVQHLVIPGYVFIHTSPQTAKSLSSELSLGIRFLKQYKQTDPAIIPEKQMRDFMFIVNFSEMTRLITRPLKQGDKVRVIKGPLMGIEGELIRISGHKRVVVRLSPALAVSTTYIPASFLETIDQEAPNIL